MRSQLRSAVLRFAQVGTKSGTKKEAGRGRPRGRPDIVLSKARVATRGDIAPRLAGLCQSQLRTRGLPGSANCASERLNPLGEISRRVAEKLPELLISCD